MLSRWDCWGIYPFYSGTSITNCANYGNILSHGPYSYRTRVGGIVGEVWTSIDNPDENVIKNCVNFGYLSQSGEIGFDFYMGGISSVDKPNIVYENCVSFGAISYK